MYTNIRIESDKNSLNNLLNAIDDFQINVNNFKGYYMNPKNNQNYQQNDNDFYDDMELNNNDIPYANDNGRVNIKNNDYTGNQNFNGSDNDNQLF